MASVSLQTENALLKFWDVRSHKVENEVLLDVHDLLNDRDREKILNIVMLSENLLLLGSGCWNSFRVVDYESGNVISTFNIAGRKKLLARDNYRVVFHENWEREKISVFDYLKGSSVVT